MSSQNTNRRDFLGMLAGTAAIMGVGAVASPLTSQAADAADPEAWFKNLKGKHRVVFDATEPKDILTFAWPKVFLMSNAGAGTPESDCGVIVVLRHDAIPYAMNDDLWAKYKFGEAFKINDPRTKAPATRNPFWKCKPDDYAVPGVGPVQIGLDDLQGSGVMFCVCDMALTVQSAVFGMKTNQPGDVIKKEWLAGLLPGVAPMPSGVWAVSRAQEHGCSYIFAG
ncbi:MAG: twin-arginine translocation signal domain-containing protein [Bacteroidetes bacterium]|nr:twin-arginine translocation signal domain-containing protein [Bacteroidota bacterium]